MLRIAIYARYSTDRQGETSIEGQTAICREVAGREGWHVSDVFQDRALSGADLTRPGYRALLEAGRRGAFALILVEEVSRLWRSQSEQWRAVEEFESIGLQVVGVRDGIDTRRDGYELLLAVQGAMNARARKEAAWRTHRGLSTVFDRGQFAGGLAYGYRSKPVGFNDRGEADGYRLEIDPDQARWVAWIHERYAAGASIRQIVFDLNAQGIKSPRGGSWAVSALYGSPTKGTGILNNEIYTGRYVWNRTRWVRGPNGKKRKRIDRPASEWRVSDRPELRIVADDTWQAVQKRLKGPNKTPRGRPPQTILAGLLKCGCCGGAVVAVSAYDYGCASRKDRGPTVCAGVRVKRGLLESRLLEILREDLASDEAIEDLRREVARLLREASDQTDQKDTKRRMASLDREISNLVSAVAQAGWSQALAERLKAAETERATLAATAEAPTITPAMIPRLVDRYRAMIADLPKALNRDPDQARQALREALGEVKLTPDGPEVYAEVAAFGQILNLVAGDRFRIKNRRYRVA